MDKGHKETSQIVTLFENLLRFNTIPPHTHTLWHLFNECRELKLVSPRWQLKIFTKTDAVLSLHVYWKDYINAWSSNLPVQVTETIEFRKEGRDFWSVLILKNLKRRHFNIVILIINVFWVFIWFYIIWKAYWSVLTLLFLVKFRMWFRALL